MNEQAHEHYKSLIAAYTLGATDPREERDVRTHLLTCDECMAEADGHSYVTDKLALAVTPVDLPAGFEEAIFDQVREDRESGPAPAPARKRWGPATTLTFGSLMLVLAIVTAALVNTSRDLDLERSATTALLRTEDALRLRGDGTVAALVPSTDGSVFVVQGLQEVPEDMTYQLWLLGEDDPVSAGTFEVSDGAAIFESDRSLEGFSGAAVTVEPEGGSPGPTTDPVISSA